MRLPRIFHLVVVSVLALPVYGNIQAPETDLNLLLKQCSVYWERLLKTTFGLRCREEIRERIYHSHPDKGGIVNLSELESPKGSEVRAFVYDLLFVYRDGAREEGRTLFAPSMKTSFPRAELTIYYKDYRMIAWNVL